MNPVWTAAVVPGTVVVCGALQRSAYLFARRYAGSKPERTIFRSFVARTHAPGGLLLVLFGLAVDTAWLPVPPSLRDLVSHALTVAFIATVAWLVIASSYILDDLLGERRPTDAPDNLRARRLQTQLAVVRRVVNSAVVVLGAAVSLLTFHQVRAFGATMLASAGIIAAIVGIAAQPMLTNLIAGLQIALSQPLIIDDVVVIDGYWGRIEEITLTYVVLKVWDERRLVIPVAYLMKQPFENWTRNGSELLGTVTLELDYETPIEAVRAELDRILRASSDWDGRLQQVQVTDCGPSTLSVRVLVSARDSSARWNLVCDVREGLIGFLNAHHPESLPKLRARTSGSGPPATVRS